MRLSVFMARFFRTDDRTQTKFYIHISVYGQRTVIISSACQINCHAPVPIDSIMDMVDIPDLCHNLRFLGIIVRLPVFPVVVIGIRIYVQSAQQPADCEFLTILVCESISL